MRWVQPLGVTIAFAGVFEAGAGVLPRQSSSDYPARQDIQTATIAAALVAPDQVKKTFSSDFNKKYVVVEVAVYPKDAGAIDIESFDFMLKLSTDELVHPARPEEVVKVWREKDVPFQDHKVNVTSGVDVVYAGGTGPNGGTRGWGTSAGVGVEVGGSGQPAPLPPSPPSGQQALEARIRDKALPEGQTSRAVAGYLYFRLASKALNGASITLEYLKDGAIIGISLPSK